MNDVAAVLVVGLGAWRLASLMVNEEGPFGLFERMRAWAGVPRVGIQEPMPFFGGLLSCVWCCSMYSAAALWAVWHYLPAGALWLAAAAIAPIVDRWVRQK